MQRFRESLRMVEEAGPQGDTLIVGLTFRCNSRCRFCIVETEIADGLDAGDSTLIEAVLERNQRTREYSRLSLSGAEVTLLPDLAKIARAATTAGGFEVVRIQTNGRKLADEALCRELIDAGIREYFVSIHAHTSELDARMTRAPASFREMQAGVENLLAAGATVMSNTVTTVDNVEHLPAIADFLLELGIRHSQLWNFLEIGESGQTDQLVPVVPLCDRVREAVSRLRRGGSEVVLKWYPRCLLGEHGGLLDNRQPPMLIRDEFQRRLGENFGFDCAHRDSCRWFGRGCDGLHERFIAVHGDQRDVLAPEAFPDV